MELEVRGTKVNVWHWCRAKGNEVRATTRCNAEQCPRYREEGEEMAGRRMIRWDEAAELTVPGAGEAPLWEWARDEMARRIEEGGKAGVVRLEVARQCGLEGENSMMVLIRAREAKLRGEPAPWAKQAKATEPPATCGRTNGEGEDGEGKQDGEDEEDEGRAIREAARSATMQIIALRAFLRKSGLEQRARDFEEGFYTALEMGREG